MIYFSWATQIILAIISFLWLIPYYIAFKVGNRKYMSKTLDLSCNNRYTLMYYSGFFISILWYIMPFLNQPRFKLNIFSLFDIKVILLENVLYNIILIALIGYFMSVWGTKVVNCNLQATKDGFLHPSKLITEGPYKKVRNPMIMGDLFCHLSFILLLGAIHTLCLYIISLLSGEILPQRKLPMTITLRNISSEVGLIKYIFDVASFEENLPNRI